MPFTADGLFSHAAFVQGRGLCAFYGGGDWCGILQQCGQDHSYSGQTNQIGKPDASKCSGHLTSSRLDGPACAEDESGSLPVIMVSGHCGFTGLPSRFT